MMISEKAKQHIDSCRFCWMCHHICPIGNATGQERNTARARALGISLVNRNAIDLSEIIDNIYECATCGGCVHICNTGWDPVMFTKEVRLQAALDGKLPSYIQKLADNCLSVGNAYGKTESDPALEKAIAAHSAPSDTLLYLGADARLRVPEQAVKAIRVLEKAKLTFTVLKDEPASGAQSDFLIGAAAETKEQMQRAAKALAGYSKVIVYDPADAVAFCRLYREYGVAPEVSAVTWTAFLAELIADKKLAAKNTGKAVVLQDPYQLARELDETEPFRAVVSAFADAGEMLLNRDETVWAGNLLMAEYAPQIVEKVAARRIFNAVSVGAKAMVAACVGEYAALRAVPQNDVEILSLEDLILG